MIPKYLALVFFFLGAAVGIFTTVIFALLSIKRLRDEKDLKDSRIQILQGQIEKKDAIINGFIEKEKEK